MSTRPFNFVVSAPTSEASWPISIAASGIAPKQFVEYMGTNVNATTSYGRRMFISQASGGPDNIVDWQGKTAWDTQGKKWWYSGGSPAQSNPGSGTMVRFDPASNQFANWQGQTLANSGLWNPYGDAHNFDAADIDIPGRRMIRRIALTYSGANNISRIGAFSIDSPVDTGNPVYDFDNAGPQGYFSLSVFPAAASVLVFDKSNSIRRFTLASLPASGQAIPPQTAISTPFSHNGGLSMAHGNYVYFSQGYGGALGFARVVYSAPNFTVQTLPNSPVSMTNDYGQSNGGAFWAKLKNDLFCFHCNGNIYRCDLSQAVPAWSTTPYVTLGAAGSLASLYAGYSIDTSAGNSYIKQFVGGPVITNSATGDGVMLCVLALNDAPTHKAFLWKP